MNRGELKQALIVRLEKAGNDADQTDDFKWNCFRALPGIADEVIRQMEWARREGMKELNDLANKENAGQGSDVRHKIIDFGWPTLAPDDWKPQRRTNEEGRQ